MIIIIFHFIRYLNMLRRIKRTFVWLSRCHHSRGFGVQSPWAFSFINKVVNERYLYYGYSELHQQVAIADRLTLKLCRFYFRLSNYCQPRLVIDFAPGSHNYYAYIKGGCRRSRIITVGMYRDASWDAVFTDSGVIDMARISLVGDYRLFMERALNRVGKHSVFVVQNIKKNADSKIYWEQLKADSRVGITFDLYYCGVIFFNKDMHKMDYIVNF